MSNIFEIEHEMADGETALELLVRDTSLKPNVEYVVIGLPQVERYMEHPSFKAEAVLIICESVPSSTYFVPKSIIEEVNSFKDIADVLSWPPELRDMAFPNPTVKNKKTICKEFEGLKKYFIHLCEVDEFTNEQVTLIRDYPQLWESSVYEYQRRKDRELSTYTKHLLLIPKV